MVKGGCFVGQSHVTTSMYINITKTTLKRRSVFISDHFVYSHYSDEKQGIEINANISITPYTVTEVL